MDRRARLAQLVVAAGFGAILVLTWLLYRPGLSGGFHFDDFQNLEALGALQSEPTVDELTQYLVHGISSTLGRPVSLATFALQAHDWPANPADFVRVNILLHLLNGSLLFWWLLRLARLMRLEPAPALLVPLTAASLWLVAPIQATAVLYVVQRMTELSATFLFSGLLLYLVGRESAAHGSPRAGLGWMSLGVMTGVGVGTLAKESAVLMPLLILALESTVLAAVPRPARWRSWATVFLAVPLAAVACFLLAGPLVNGYAIRDFTLWERVMTEARVLVMYLHKTLAPWPSGIRLLYDDLPVSRSLLQPWTTLPALAAVATLLGLAWAWRRRAPLFALAVFWFFGAHVLESTVVPLEIAFEHRNYPATVGLWFALGAGLLALWRRASARHVRVALGALAPVYLLLLCLVTAQIASLWGRPLHMAAWWAETLPGSRRARVELLGALITHGLPDDARRIAQEASQQWPDDSAFHVMQFQIACFFGGPLPSIEDTLSRVATTRTEILTTVSAVHNVITLMEMDACPSVPPAIVRQIVEAMLGNRHLLLPQEQNLLLQQARALKLEGRSDEARRQFRRAVDVQPVMILLLQGILDALDAGRLDEAREYLRLAESDPRVPAVDRWSHRHDVEALRQLIERHEAGSPIP